MEIDLFKWCFGKTLSSNKTNVHRTKDHFNILMFDVNINSVFSTAAAMCWD